MGRVNQFSYNEFLPGFVEDGCLIEIHRRWLPGWVAQEDPLSNDYTVARIGPILLMHLAFAEENEIFIAQTAG
jgi:hypothetical protein